MLDSRVLSEWGEMGKEDGYSEVARENGARRIVSLREGVWGETTPQRNEGAD